MEDRHTKKKLLFLISSLQGGGAERVMALLCNGFSREYEVCLVTYLNPEADAYKLSNSVKRYDLSQLKVTTKNPASKIKRLYTTTSVVRKLRSIIQLEKPDCCISFMATNNLLLLMSTRLLKTKVIISQRVSPSHEHLVLPIKLLCKILYPLCNKFVIQNQELTSWASKITKNHNKCCIIENPVNSNVFNHIDKQNILWHKPFILSVGRLHHQKGMDILIKAYAKIADKTSYDLVILGEGPERDSLERLISSYQLQKSVHLIGFKNNVYEYMNQAAFIVLASRYEGLPNVLIEAITLQKPVISSDCDFGPRDIIDHEESGLLVPTEDIDALANAMLTYINEPHIANEHAEKAYKQADKYRLESILKKWEAIL